MEPVPETERMEEFRPSPLPSLRVQNASLSSSVNITNNHPSLDFELRKPPTLRRSTDPSPTSSPTSPSWLPMPPGPTSAVAAALPYRPRAASPLSFTHMRSRSAASLPPPAMTRTQSMPGVNGAGHLLYSPQLRPQSPSGSPSRVRAPRKPVDEAFPSSPTRMSVHDPERKLTERNSSLNLVLPNSSGVSPALRLRRPSSPLRHVAHSSTSSLQAGVPTTPSSVASSPSFRAYDSSFSGGSYPFTSMYPSSSVPSTPTSTRSRSPSISSLETIPDSPDAEEAALEADRIAQLKAAADAAEGGDSGDSKSRGSLDVPRGRTLSFGSRDKRKRWSVCGAERRQDLDLETIWED